MPTDTLDPVGGAAGANPAGNDLATLSAGLDALETTGGSGTRGWRSVARSLVPPVLAIALLLVVWWIVVAAKLQPSYMLPSPQSVGRSIADGFASGDIPSQCATASTAPSSAWSVGRARDGAGAVAGQCGVGATRLRPAGITGLMVLPSVAWVPVAILWFGISTQAMLFVVILGATPSIANGLVGGIGQIPPLYAKVGQVLGRSRLNSIRFIVMPAALPGYLGGLRQVGVRLALADGGRIDRLLARWVSVWGRCSIRVANCPTCRW